MNEHIVKDYFAVTDIDCKSIITFNFIFSNEKRIFKTKNVNLTQQ